MSQRENRLKNAVDIMRSFQDTGAHLGKIGYDAGTLETAGHYIGPVRDRALESKW